jgi:phosphinothricin acetyltransferase
MNPITVRDSTDTDMPAVQRIYAYYVLHGLGSFEEKPPSVSELQRRRRTCSAVACPISLQKSTEP